MNLKVFHLKIVNSTNDFAIRKIKQGKKKGIVISDNQKKGRGRYGNKWISLSGNLFISIFYKLNKKIGSFFAKRLEKFDDKFHSYKFTKPFAGHLILTAKK